MATITGDYRINYLQGAIAQTIDDTLYGLGGNDVLWGMSGNDTLNGGTGNDIMLGGAGNDTYYLDSVADLVIEIPGEGVDTVIGSVSYTLGTAVENLTLSGTAGIGGTGNSLNNTLIGNSAGNVLLGGAGNDVLKGGAGNDTLDGGAGADAMTGGLGNDTFVVDNVGDAAIESSGGGTDTVRASISETLDANVENLVLLGTALRGTGHGGANAITGNASANLIDGGGGADVLRGAGGNDTLVFDAADLVVDGGAGNDALLIKTSSTTIDLSAPTRIDGIERITLTGTSSKVQLSSAGIRSMSDAGVLFVDGDSNDAVSAQGQWQRLGDSGGYARYVQDGATLNVSLPIARSGIPLLGTAPANHAPVVYAPTSATINEGQSRVFSSANGNGVRVGDADGDALSVSLSVGHGVLTLAQTSGLASVSGNGSANVTVSGTTTNINAALNGLRLLENSNFNGADHLSIRAKDAAVTTSDAVDITVAPVNDAPQLIASLPSLKSVALSAGAPAAGSIPSAATLVGSLLSKGVNVTDVDGSSSFGVAVTSVDSTLGTWYFSTNAGASWAKLGTPSLSAARLLAADSNTYIYLDPNGTKSGTYSSAVKVLAWDRSGAGQSPTAEGGTFNITATGGSSAFSSIRDDLGITISNGSASRNISIDNLHGSNGFALRGASAGAGVVAHGGYSGRAVSGGDINGDGLADLVIGEPDGEPVGASGTNNPDRGQTHVVFGTTRVTGLAGVSNAGLDLRTLNGVTDSNADGKADGFTINGSRLSAFQHSGSSLAVGDINGDGKLDVMTGDRSPVVPRAFGVFGRTPTSNIELTDLSSSHGFNVRGNAVGAPMVVAAGSVINGPHQDFALSESTATVAGRTNAGLVSLVLGTGSAASALNGMNVDTNSKAFNFFGGAGAKAGTSLAIGDIDGDRLGDLVIGAAGASGGNGKVYVVFGHALQAALLERGTNAATPNSLPNVFGTGLDLTRFDGSDRVSGTDNDLNNDGRVDGFVLNGFTNTNYGDAAGVGKSVALGNINGDAQGRQDLIIGLPAEMGPGGAVVVFGKASGFNDVSLASLATGTGFHIKGAPITGIGTGAYGGGYAAGTGTDVASARSFNGDGFDDIVIGASGFNGGKGQAYVVYGKSGSADVNLVSMSSGQGITITGSAAASTSHPKFGAAVDGIGDFNGDGFADVLIGAPTADAGTGRLLSGKSYVIFGGPSGTVHLSEGNDVYTDGDDAEVVVGHAGNDVIDGRGGDDVLIGGTGNDTLIGGSGVDALRGAAGDDVLVLDTHDLTVEGGAGLDTLRFDGSGQALDLSQFAGVHMVGVERLDMHAGSNSLGLAIGDILDLEGDALPGLPGGVTGQTLVVDGDADDSVVVSGLGLGHTDPVGQVSYAGHDYLHFSDGVSNLLVGTELQHNVTV